MPRPPGPHPPLGAHNHARSPRTQTENTGATQESPRDIKNQSSDTDQSDRPHASEARAEN
eukprot:1357084-Alexandrium_andersonii.AAC.1